MEYYVIYDIDDNIVAYLEDFKELKKYLPNYRDRDIKRRFLNSCNNFIQIIIDNNLFRVYKFY